MCLVRSRRERGHKTKGKIMLANVKTMIVTAIGMDPSITDDMKMLALKILSGSGNDVRCGSGEPLVVSRSEAARMIGVGPKRIDDFTRRGDLKRVFLPGCSRATGILRSSIENVVMAGAR